MGIVKLERLADPARPETMHHRGIIQLSRSQTKTLADALDPIFREHGSRKRLALALGVKENTVAKIMVRKASTDMNWEQFHALANRLGVDVSAWDVHRGHGP
jgi:adenylate kinase family enzyme